MLLRREIFLAEIETDKATMEFESISDEGRIGKILVPEGAEGIKVNAPIAELLPEMAKQPSRRRQPSAAEAPSKPAPAEASKPKA